MGKELTVKQRALEKAGCDMDYLEVILDKYYGIWESESENPLEHFNDHQIGLFFYGVLFNQVQNGGFLQLIFNDYARLVFSEPMIESLKLWGAIATAELLASMTDICLQVDQEIDKTSLESLSKSYSQYPMFEGYDRAFYENDGTKEVKEYVSSHLSDFITVV